MVTGPVTNQGKSRDPSQDKGPVTVPLSLPAAAAAIAEAYPDTIRSGKLSMRNYLRATKACKLYDFETSTWHGYDAARPAR